MIRPGINLPVHGVCFFAWSKTLLNAAGPSWILGPEIE